MPVKRRSSKRKIDPVAELFAWENTFDDGYDVFSELPDIGVATDHSREPSREAAADAWKRLGARHLAQSGRERPCGYKVWALEEFGEPAHAG